MKWQLDIAFHWPHDRCAIGWEYIGASKEEAIDTFTLYLVICTISLHFYK